MKAGNEKRAPKTPGGKPFDIDLVSGGIFKSVGKLALPFVLLNMVNGAHGLIDHILVGRYVESPNSAANGAIGIAWQVFLIFIVLVTSLYYGMNVLVARYTGRQDRDTLSQVVYETLLISFYMLIGFAAPMGFIFAPQLLQLARPSPDQVQYALPYLRTMFLCGSPVFFQFLLTGAMQASGDGKTPLYLGILTTCLNVVLSFALITGFGPFPKLGVTGAAVATCAAPFVSVCVAVYIILSGRTIIRRPPKFTPLPSWGVTKTVVRIGFPTGMLGTMLNASGVAVFWFIGSLEDGELAQNAYTLCYTQLFSAVQWASWALRNTASSLIGQNIGAGKTDRGIRAVYVTTGVALCWALIMGTLYFTIPKALLGLFSVTDPAVLAYGAALLRFLAFSGLFLIGALALTGGLIGAGDTRTPMAIAFFSQIIVLLGTCFVCYQLDALTAKVIWASILVSHAMRFALTAFAFWREGWRGIDVTIEDEDGDGKEHMADAIAQETAAREDGA